MLFVNSVRGICPKCRLDLKHGLLVVVLRSSLYIGIRGAVDLEVRQEFTDLVALDKSGHSILQASWLLPCLSTIWAPLFTWYFYKLTCIYSTWVNHRFNLLHFSNADQNNDIAVKINTVCQYTPSENSWLLGGYTGTDWGPPEIQPDYGRGQLDLGFQCWILNEKPAEVCD